MSDGPPSALRRTVTKTYRSLFGAPSTNLPIEGAVPEARRKKKEMDEAQGSALRQLGALARGKSPIKK